MRTSVLAVVLVVLIGCAAMSSQPVARLDDLVSGDTEVALAANRKIVENIDRAHGILLQGLHHPIARIRRLCCAYLGRLGTNASVDAIVACLYDSDSSVRVQAAQTLRVVRSWRDSGPLLALLADRHGAPLFRVALTEAFGTRREVRATPVLKAIVADAREPDNLRRVAAMSLGFLGRASNPLADFLWHILQTPKLPGSVARACIVSIGRVRDVNSYKYLVGILSRSELPPRWRSSAAKGLDLLHDVRALPFLARAADARDVPLLVRVTAVTAIYGLGGRHSHACFAPALNDREILVRRAAVQAIARTHDLNEVDNLTRAAAVEKDCDTQGLMRATLGCLHRELDEDSREMMEQAQE